MLRRLLPMLLCALLLLTTVGCQQEQETDTRYTENTEIITNPDAPTPGDPDLAAIEGYTPVEAEGLQLPFTVPDTDIEVLSVGGYSGVYLEDDSGDLCDGVPALVIRNSGDQVISYSSLTVRFADGEDQATFMPTNIPAGCCALVLTSDKEQKAAGITRLEVVQEKQILLPSLTMLSGTVGVSYRDGRFIVSNLSDGEIGAVYIRYKNISPGNVYLGGMTRTVNTERLASHRTQEVFASFDTAKSAVIAVECIE